MSTGTMAVMLTTESSVPSTWSVVNTYLLSDKMQLLRSSHFDVSQEHMTFALYIVTLKKTMENPLTIHKM